MNNDARTSAIRALDQLGPTSTPVDIADQIVKVTELSLGRTLVASDLESIAEGHDSLAKEFRRRAVANMADHAASRGGVALGPSATLCESGSVHGHSGAGEGLCVVPLFAGGGT